MIFVEVKFGGVSMGEVEMSFTTAGNWITAEIAALGADDAQVSTVEKNAVIDGAHTTVDSSVDQDLVVIFKASDASDLLKGDFAALLDLFVEKLSEE
jgi:hypothetical protein